MVKASSSASASASLKDYLKRYADKDVEDKKKNKKKKKVKAEPLGVRVVDEDPVWAKPMKPEEDDNDSEDEEKPVVDEDIEVKRMKRLELLRSKRPFGAISEDGSGWVSVSDTPNLSNTKDETPDISPPHRNRIRNDTPEPNEQKPDMSPPRKRRARNDTPSPEPNVRDVIADLSPPRKQKLHNNRSPKPEKSRDLDISPPRRIRRGIVNEDDTQVNKGGDLSPPRKGRGGLSPPRKGRGDLSPPRKGRGDLSPPRKGRGDLSPPRKGRADRIQQTRHGSTEIDVPRASISRDLSPPRSVKKEPSKEQRRTGLISKHDIREEHDRVTKAVWQSFEEMDPEDTGRGAAGVYRDKVTGKKISKEEFMKSKKKEKPKEIKLEWGKGLAQKREAEERQQDLELEKEKPFARTRDDADLDKMLKDRLRWGDPMAHLVKKKQFEPVLLDLGDNENMKKSGFVIPQDVPSHSWLRRGLDAAPNRYGIKPGRHWDGVDRSTGYEKDLFRRSNEKQATEKEAYLWSVADM